ncbi:GDSL-like lipase/acylhydrolase family protein [Leptospira yanagawae serovar Saopaulo str. Sao Paulo = ATCC 700523]|uniref:GDSL-like lipase/acylhydrolase family protein n=1 Tax=Leptospira yanagawae serovar Saopaulo str. Sao Paulo = ATCC 700523 TaxID=1249483 RepID=A0A5E8HBI2_9LEPT|nr:lipase [Leptospira yanagawae]EOQ88589.1 GDSL-like lipase/acylhydrolase family protein [Leptospira yanagawae serovar Saopaulo str. Sao Paulo = ATCC 700523]
MKKVNLKWSGKTVRSLFLILALSITIFLCFRSIDRWILVPSLQYGSFHYPPESNLPFFRNGEVEMGITNQFGIRETKFEKTTSCHYLLLGDSQTFGSGIFLKDRFSEILNAETECQWFNVSVPGYTLENEFSMYKKIEGNLSFQKLYLVVYGNDVYETGDTPDYLHFTKRQKWYWELLAFLLPEYTRSLWKRAYFQTIQVRMAEELKRISTKEIPSSKNVPQTNIGQKIPPNYTSFKTLYSISPNYFYESLNVNTVSNHNFNRWKQVLFRLMEEVTKKQIQLTIIYIPLDVEFDSNRFEIYKEIGFPMDPNWLTGDSELVSELNQLATQLDVPIIDLRKTFRKEKDLLQPEDIHFNEKANRLIADTIKKSL